MQNILWEYRVMFVYVSAKYEVTCMNHVTRSTVHVLEICKQTTIAATLQIYRIQTNMLHGHGHIEPTGLHIYTTKCKLPKCFRQIFARNEYGY